MTFKLTYLALLVGLMFFAPSAEAAVSDRVKFSIPAKAVMSKVLSKPGQKQFLVASNAPFQIFAENVIGVLRVNVQTSGTFKGVKFGDAAQLPGLEKNCHQISSFLPSSIYNASQKTAKSKGSLKAQSVLLTVFFEEAAEPDLYIKPAAALSKMPISTHQMCE